MKHKTLLEKLKTTYLRLYCTGIDAPRLSQNDKSKQFEKLHFIGIDDDRHYETDIDQSFKNASKWKEVVKYARQGYNFCCVIEDPKYITSKKLKFKDGEPVLHLNADVGPDPILKEDIDMNSPGAKRLGNTKKLNKIFYIEE